MIIAVDFDGTLWIDGKPNSGLIRNLVMQQRRGNTVILWSCREGSQLQEAVSLLREQGFVPDYVNRNAPAALRMMGHESRKIYADLYIDDKSVRV